MLVLIFGLPGSGKTILAQELTKKIPCLYLNGDKVREVFKDSDFSMAGRVTQARRMRALADMARNTLVIADFVCPTKETREIFNPDLSIWMNTISVSRYDNTNEIFENPSACDFIITEKNALKYAPLILDRINSAYGHQDNN